MDHVEMVSSVGGTVIGLIHELRWCPPWHGPPYVVQVFAASQKCFILTVHNRIRGIAGFLTNKIGCADECHCPKTRRVGYTPARPGRDDEQSRHGVLDCELVDHDSDLCWQLHEREVGRRVRQVLGSHLEDCQVLVSGHCPILLLAGKPVCFRKIVARLVVFVV